MTNTGTWNSDFALFFLFVFFSPIVLFFVAGVFLRILEMQMIASGELLVEDDCDAVEKSPVVNNPVIKTRKRSNEIENNDMHLDAVSGLVGIGYKKSEARRIVARACNKKHYQNAEDIITDVISSVYK